MNDFTLVFRGILAGLIISAPVGPVNVLCISRALTKGRRAGVVAGFGAGTADTIYGAVASFSIQFVIAFLMREQSWVRLFGGILLLAIGVRFFLRSPRRLKEVEEYKSPHSDYVSAFLLNLTNPTTVLSFLAVLTGLGLHERRPVFSSLILVGGLFAGAMLWWLCLAMIASRFQDQLTDRGLAWMNKVAGAAIGGFGLVTAALGWVSRGTQSGFLR